MIQTLVAALLAAVLVAGPVGAEENVSFSDNIVPVDTGETMTWNHQAVFKGNLMFVGAADEPPIGGFDVFRLDDRDPIRRIGKFECYGTGEGALSRWRNFVFQPIESVPANQRTRVGTCGEEPGSGGIRVVDVSDPTRPEKVGFIELTCGSHNVTTAPRKGKLWIFNSNGCGGESTSGLSTGQGGVGNTALTVEVIKFNPRHPSKSTIESKPTLDIDDDPATKMAGCHDITIFRSSDLGVCVGVGRSLLIDVSDPPNPEGLALLDTKHIGAGGASFSWDGRYLILNEVPAKGAGYGESCLGARGSAGGLDVWDVSDPREPRHVMRYVVPHRAPMWRAPDGDYRCFAMDVNVVPMVDPTRLVVLSAWGTDGLSVIDFSDVEDPRELAYWMPLYTNITYWSYWYNGRIYMGENFVREIGFSDPGAPASLRVLEMKGLGPTRDYQSGFVPQWQDASDLSDWRSGRLG